MEVENDVLSSHKGVGINYRRTHTQQNESYSSAEVIMSNRVSERFNISE